MVESFDGSEFLSLRGLELLEIADRMARGNLSLVGSTVLFSCCNLGFVGSTVLLSCCNLGLVGSTVLLSCFVGGSVSSV
ncbi:hypothetical protein HanRHA438_Chr05g0246851 [Helianthus annuus]|nr:hypothetical protein HanIR_Chr05g0255451 [Helianthus annuus]KAJ0920948.1 hypothetical protein HanRHA438_Chr05g0246851 [Helianthus annuus]